VPSTVHVSDKILAKIDDFQKEHKNEYPWRQSLVDRIFEDWLNQQSGISHEAKENSGSESIETEGNHDFGANACQFRKPHDATNYKCFNLKHLVRVSPDGVVPKDICRICEHEKDIQRISTGEPITQSGKLYKQYVVNDRERKRQERLEYFAEKESIKTKAQAERQKIRGQSNQKVVISYGDSEGVDPFSFY
jgi:hypothetical protein